MRPLLAELAAAPDTTTVRRLWKALTNEEKAQAITASLADDPDGWIKNNLRASIAKVMRFRPQTVATWPKAKLATEGARLPLDEPSLLSSFLVDLHLGHRRPMMAAFLDSLGIANDEGRIDSENTVVPVQEAAKLSAAASALANAYDHDQVVTYFLTLLLQDANTWGELRTPIAALAGLSA
jgi:hypothetical protein